MQSFSLQICANMRFFFRFIKISWDKRKPEKALYLMVGFKCDFFFIHSVFCYRYIGSFRRYTAFSNLFSSFSCRVRTFWKTGCSGNCNLDFVCGDKINALYYGDCKMYLLCFFEAFWENSKHIGWGNHFFCSYIHFGKCNEFPFYFIYSSCYGCLYSTCHCATNNSAYLRLDEKEKE